MHSSITVGAQRSSTLRASATSRATSYATSILAQVLASLLVMMAVATNAIAEDYTFTTFAGSASLDGTGTNARFSSSTAVAVDGSGTVYVADTTNHTIRKITAGGLVTTLAGLSGTSGSANGTGAAARFYSPSGLTVDSGGNVYVADTSNRTVRKITTGGVVTTIAGTAGVFGSTDGPGSSALFSFTGPTSLAIDSSGVLYVLDDANGIRKIDVSGTVSTLMSGSFGGICVAADGFIYVTGTSDHTIRKITAAGVGTILAGTSGSSGYTNGPGASARFNGPSGIGITSGGLLYVADTSNNAVRTIDSTTGATSSIAVSTSPHGIAVASDGTVFIANTESGGNGTIKKLTTPGNVLSTYAGNVTYHTKEGTADGVGQAARFDHPRAMARGSDGVLYVADTINQVIRTIATDGTVSTLAGTLGVTGHADGSGSAAIFASPSGIAVDGSGFVYVSDTEADCIRMITPAGVVTTLAGNPGSPGWVDGTGSGAQLQKPRGISIRSNGDLVVADTGNSCLRIVTSVGVVTTVTEIGGGTLSNPYGVAVGPSDLFIATNTGQHTIRTVTAAGVSAALAGMLNVHGTADGTGSAAQFFSSEGVAVDAAGNAFIGDTRNDTVRKISTSGQVVTIGGIGETAGSTDGIGSSALFNYPTGIVVDGTGIIYVLDTNNSTVRKGTPPVAVTVTMSATAQDFDGSPKPVTVATTPSVSTTVTYAGSATVPTNAGTYAVIATVTQAGFIGSASGTLTITQATQTITFGTIPTQTLGVAPLTLGATASSGLPVSYVVTSGPATVSGTTLTITGVGTVVVEAQQAGDANRAAATPVPQSFIVNPAAPIISSSTTATGTVGAVFSYAIVASSTPTSYAATGLPAGLLLNSTTGVISGTPTGAVTSTISLSATNAGGTGSATLTLTVNPAAPVINSAITANGRVGTAFTYTITASHTPTLFGATGLPAGLAINTATGLISGTPTTVAVSAVTISATNAGGTGSTTLTLTVVPAVPVISSATTVAGNVDVAFTYAITASSTPTVFGATGLPTGLEVNTTTGVISGTPTAIGVSTVTITATNAGGTGSATLTMTVTLAAPVITSAATANGTVGTAFTFTVTASGAPTNFGATGLPAGLTINPTTGVISGTPTAASAGAVSLSAANATGTGTSSLAVTIVTPAAPPSSGTSDSGGGGGGCGVGGGISVILAALGMCLRMALRRTSHRDDD